MTSKSVQRRLAVMEEARKERPILFNGEMVRAILDGRKTQTRRVIKPQPNIPDGSILKVGRHDGQVWGRTPEMDKDGPLQELSYKNGVLTCPYGIPGDRLWVRETWFQITPPDAIAAGATRRAWYKADSDNPENVKWKPSIHMPRWASRILLEVVSVRVERVQDISGDDAKAEGVEIYRNIHQDQDETLTDKQMFWCLWDSINEKRGFGWDVNPFNWVVEFKPIEREG